MADLHVIILAFLLLPSSTHSLSAPLHFHGDHTTEFSNSTANGVRRQGVDTSLRTYAFKRISHARTGVIYNVSLPPSLHGISSQVMRVRAGSARRRGLVFNQFSIPKGVIVLTGGPFVVMVYRSIFNFTLYSLPQGYQFLSPIVGIVIYTSLNASFDDAPLPEMNVFSPDNPITITIPINPPNTGPNIPALCAFFDINGTLYFSNVSSPPNVCSSHNLMDAALVQPSPLSSPSTPPPTPFTGLPTSSRRISSQVWKFVLVAVLVGLVGIAILGATLLVGMRVQDKCQIAKLRHKPSDNQETLQTSIIGHTRAPTAAGVRTKPMIETGSLQ